MFDGSHMVLQRDELAMESNQETVEETVSQPNEEEGKGTNKTKKTSPRQKPKPWKTPGKYWPLLMHFVIV